jgi:Flp pilus assembly protein TadG
MKAPRTADRRNERGVVIIWTAFFMLMMLGFVAIGIDVAKVMATRTELQNAADAAALAGASALNLVTGKVRPDSALIRAQQTALRNEAFVDSPKPITLLAGDVLVDPDANTVKVTVRRNATTDGAMITHVAQVLGIRNVDLSATATAKADLTCSQCEKLVPMGAIPPGGGTTFQVGCGAPNPYTLFQGQGGGAQGNWFAVDFPDCDEGACAGMPSTGANTFRCLLANGYGCCVAVGQRIWTETGQMNGPAVQGLQARWDADSDPRSNICFSDYTGNGSRVVNVPVITPLMGGGKQEVTVLGLAAFFLRSRPTGGPAQPVLAEFIHDVVPGTGGGCNSTVYTLRLIQ